MPAYLQMLQEYLQNATTNENIDSELENIKECTQRATLGAVETQKEV